MKPLGLTLTRSQHRKLEQLDESFRVVGWHSRGKGPLLRDVLGVVFLLTRTGRMVIP